MKYWTQTIQKGSQGDEVKKWQEYLNSQGYSLGVDGDFGDKTLAATTDWQTKQGLGADGIVGKNTWGKAGYTYVDFKPTDLPTIDNTSYDDTTAGKAALGKKDNAFSALYGTYNPDTGKYEGGYKPFDFKNFNYDVNEDALYQQLKDKYIQQGKLAMEDTIGKASAMTGGYGNSYAQSVGQQAYQGQLDNLNDNIPELYDMALARYNTEYNTAYDKWEQGYEQLLNSLGIATDEYYNGADKYYSERNNANTEAWKEYDATENARNNVINNYWKSLDLNKDVVNNSPKVEEDPPKVGDTPPVIEPRESENTKAFVDSLMPFPMFLSLGGTSKTPSLQGGGGRSYAEYKNYIRGELEKVWDLLDDSERAHLIKLYEL